MFDFDFGVGDLEIKLAIVLLFRCINTVDLEDEEYKALKVIVDKFEKRIKDSNELVEKFNKTGKF